MKVGTLARLPRSTAVSYTHLQKALEDQNTKAKELADKLADAREEAGKLGDIMGNELDVTLNGNA